MRRVLPVALAALAGLLVAGTMVLLINGDDETASGPGLGSDAVDATPDEAGETDAGRADADETAAGGDGDQAAGPSVSVSTTSVPSGASTAPGAAGVTSTIEVTTDTVEADDVDPDVVEDGSGGGGDTEGDTTGGGGDDGGGGGTDDGNTGGGDDGPDETVPTIPPATDGTCRLDLSEFDGESGVVELGGDGACAVVGVTILAVNPRDDLATVRWGRDIRVCQRHPAASAVAVQADSADGAVDLAQGFNRDPDGGSTPLDAIVITFANQETPISGPRPIAVCRTDNAELSIVHRPPA